MEDKLTAATSLGGGVGLCGDGGCSTRRTVLPLSVVPSVITWLVWIPPLELCSLLFDLDQKFKESCLPFQSP